jgi:hypothetical protein
VAVPQLIAASADHDYEVRTRAAQALWSVDPAGAGVSALPQLLPRLRFRWRLFDSWLLQPLYSISTLTGVVIFRSGSRELEADSLPFAELQQG